MKEGIGDFNKLYWRYKDYLLPIFIIFASIILFAQFVIPQAQEMFAIRTEESAIRNNIDTLRKNLDFLSSLNDSNLNSQLQTVSSALPQEKDFVGILNAISTASFNSGVMVDDYVFQVGDLSPKLGKGDSRPSLSILLALRGGGVNGAKNFLAQLSKTVPISETSDIQMTKGSSKVTVVFYYRPIPPIIYNYTSLMKPLDSNEKSTLEKLSTWKSAISFPSFPSFPSASPSGAF